MNILECKDYDDFKNRSGMQGKQAINFLLDQLTELKKQQEKT